MESKRKLLVEAFPGIAEIFDPDDNPTIDIEKVTIGSSIRLVISCPLCGLKRSCVVGNIYRGHTVCRKCSNDMLRNKRRLLSLKKSSLALNEEIADEWHPTLNKRKPHEVTSKSNSLAWWCCRNCQTVWQMTVYKRVIGQGCPRCRKSHGEKTILKILRKLKFEFEMQASLPGLIYKQKLRFDFFIPLIKTAIEFQGEQHFRPVKFNRKMSDEQVERQFKLCKARDATKRKYCRKYGIRLIEISYKETDIESRLLKELNVKLKATSRRTKAMG